MDPRLLSIPPSASKTHRFVWQTLVSHWDGSQESLRPEQLAKPGAAWSSSSPTPSWTHIPVRTMAASHPHLRHNFPSLQKKISTEGRLRAAGWLRAGDTVSAEWASPRASGSPSVKHTRGLLPSSQTARLLSSTGTEPLGKHSGVKTRGGTVSYTPSNPPRQPSLGACPRQAQAWACEGDRYACCYHGECYQGGAGGVTRMTTKTSQ